MWFTVALHSHLSQVCESDVFPNRAEIWLLQATQLADMGFTDISANIEALEAHDGNVQRAVEYLLR